MGSRSRPRAPVLARRLLVALLAVPAAFASTALGHGDGSGLHGTVLPAGIFLLGVLVLGASVALDARELVDRRHADAGVLVGVACVIASIGILWV